MTIQRLTLRDAATLRNPDFKSEQIVWPRNAPDAQTTITRVTMEPGAVSRRHTHARSEQIWIIEHGAATLLMSGEDEAELKAGDIVRTPAGDVHGIANTGQEPFIYIAITTPPQDFTGSYRQEKARS